MPQLPKADTSLESQGKWFPYLIPGIRFRIASVTKPEYRDAVRQLMKPRGGKRATAPEDALEGREEDLRRLAGEHLITGWDGIEDDDGAEIPYSREQAVAYMLDAARNELHAFVFSCAVDQAEYRAQAQEDARGN